jgi:hypothetical protein
VTEEKPDEEGLSSERAEAVQQAIETNRAEIARIQASAQAHINQGAEQLREDHRRMKQTEDRLQRTPPGPKLDQADE